MEMSLGRFGDARLEQAGIFFWSVWRRMAAPGLACGGLAGDAPARFGSAGFCITGA